jgi:hypothetical protein
MCDHKIGIASVICRTEKLTEPPPRFEVEFFFSKPHQKIKIDKCMVGLVNALNADGHPTISCCCGHGDWQTCPYVAFYTPNIRSAMKIIRKFWRGKTLVQLREPGDVWPSKVGRCYLVNVYAETAVPA